MPSPGEGDDAIHIEELELSVRIGVPDEERAEAQRLTVSITIWPAVTFDGMQDKVANTIDYAAVCNDVKNLAADRTDKLIETLADRIASHLLAAHPIARIRIELRKFILPDVKHVAVIVTRERARL